VLKFSGLSESTEKKSNINNSRIYNLLLQLTFKVITNAKIKNIFVAGFPLCWEISGPKSACWPLLEQNENIPPY